MPTTPRGLPYPGVSEAPAGPYSFEQLAAETNDQLQDLDDRLTHREGFLKVKGARVTDTTNSAGYVTIEFDGAPFPSACLSVVITDNNHVLGTVYPVIVAMRPESFDMRAMADAGPVANTEVNFTYIAAGL